MQALVFQEEILYGVIENQWMLPSSHPRQHQEVN